MSKIEKEDIVIAVKEAISNEIERLIRGVTDAPSADFWETMEKAMREGFRDAVSENLVSNENRGISRSLSRHEALAAMMAIESMPDPLSEEEASMYDAAWAAYDKIKVYSLHS